MHGHRCPQCGRPALSRSRHNRRKAKRYHYRQRKHHELCGRCWKRLMDSQRSRALDQNKPVAI